MESGQPPLLSVVVPVHRVEDYLAACLDSILRKAGPELEVVVVDDCSPDRSAEIAAEYAGRDPRVRLVRLPTNAGLGPARNAGLDHATGEYVWFVDSDDWLPAGSVPAVVARLAGSRPDVLVVDHQDVYEGGRVVSGNAEPLPAGRPGPFRLADQPRLLRLAQSACTKIVRRAFLAAAGLRFRPGWYEDSSFSHPVLLAADRIEVLDRVCYCYRQRATGGITRTVSPRHFEVFGQYQALFEFLDAAHPRYEPFRAELFRLMIDHYLVIAGNHRRVPAELRRRFFRQVAADHRARRPPAGYELPGGMAGLKHRLVRRNAYRIYALLRVAHRTARRLLRPGSAAVRTRREAPRAAPAPAPVPATGTSGGRTPGQ